MQIRKLLSLAVLLLASVPLALAQGTYTQIDVPGAVQTYASGINTAGDISGSYQDAMGNYHGFLLSDGVYTTIDYPGAGTYTVVYGLNDLGQLVGSALTTSQIGFLYDMNTGTFTSVIYPGSTNYTIAYGINNAGQIVGTYEGGGFELSDATYRRVFIKRSVATEVLGIAASGEIVGLALLVGGNSEIFVAAHGSRRVVRIPNAPGATAFGISTIPSALVGVYMPTPITQAGFVYQNNALTTLQFPGSNFTVAFGINAAGVVVGNFTDANSATHGFLWTPPADAAKK